MVITGQVNPRIKESFAAAVVFHSSEMKVVLSQIDSQFLRDETKQFSSEGSSGGSKFPALSPRYKKWKRRKFPGRKVMSLTGKTRKSLTTKGKGHVANYGFRPRPNWEVGTTVVTAAYHMNLANNPLYNPKMPHRDVMQMTRNQERRYTQIIAEYIVKVKGPRAEKIRKNAVWGRAGGHRNRRSFGGV